MSYPLLDDDNPRTGIFVSDQQTTADIGNVVRLQHPDGIYYGEVIAIETGDAGEIVVFRYIKPPVGQPVTAQFVINREFAGK